MKDVMIDFETFGNGKNACVCQVGAVYFDRKTGETGKRFKKNVDARSSQRVGGEFDADTVYWWLNQSPQAINSVTEAGEDIQSVMKELNEFLGPAEQIWSHATFDFVILAETLKMLGLKRLFSYRAARDIRTLLDLSGFDRSAISPVGVAHDALDDCLYQIKYCVGALNKLGA